MSIYRVISHESKNILSLTRKAASNAVQKFFHISQKNNDEIGVTLNFTQQHEELRKSLKKVIDKDINPYVDQWEAEEQFPAHAVFKKLAEIGVLGITRPTEYGGLGLDYSYTVSFLEELSSINCGGIPMGIAAHTEITSQALAKEPGWTVENMLLEQLKIATICIRSLNGKDVELAEKLEKYGIFGSEELKQEFLVPSIAGEKVSCLGVSEPEAGSDVANIKTKAVRKGDDLIINGTKMWITNGMQADWMCLLAITNNGPSHRNKSLICLPLNLPGIQRTKIHKIGMDSSDTAQFFFEDVRIPAKNIIGEEGMGFMYQMLQFQVERLAVAIPASVSCDKAIQETIEYCSQRKAFGQPIINNQYIHYRLAELKTEVEALRSLTYRIVAEMMSGKDVTFLASMAKVKSGRLEREVFDTCLQFWGGMGYSSETLIGRAYRDGRLMSIGGGADEIMLAIICKFMNILPGKAKKS